MTEKISPEDQEIQVTAIADTNGPGEPSLPEIEEPSLLTHPDATTREADPDQAARIAETIRHREAMRRGGFRF